MHKYLIAGIFGALITVNTWGAETFSGGCQYSTTTPGIPTATCQVPLCPTGGDCAPPTIDKQSAQIRFDEPLYRWTNVCPENEGSASCWEVQFGAGLEISATDPSGIRAIGLNIALESGSHREFKKVWVENPIFSSGRYSGNVNVRTNVAPGRTLSISVYELCAKDARGNTGCAFPLD
ncbi:MAG: hypothetical protein H6617_11700 [Bdellovibrionaceae bacterium]|nr:hypothetical protein [Pseudobdellovibrionaceae bacterium]